MMPRIALLTNDVETISIWLNSLRDETGLKVWKEGMPLLLDLYQKYDIRTTFFFNGDIVRLHPEIVRMIIPFGHEVACHGWSHTREDGFDLLSLKQQIEHLDRSKKLLEDITGHEIISFRSPALRVQPNTSIALLETGFRVDSSIASQRFDFLFSFGDLSKTRWILAHRCPYFTKENNLFKKGNSPLLEIPLSSFLISYIGTTLRVLPRITKGLRKLLILENKINDKPIVFLTHPNEFIDEKDLPRHITKRSKSIMGSFIKDRIRSKLKGHNLGPEAITLYEKEILGLKSAGFKFLTMKEYRETFSNGIRE